MIETILSVLHFIFVKPALWWWNKATPKLKAISLVGLLAVLLVSFFAYQKYQINALNAEIKAMERQKRQLVIDNKLQEAAEIQAKIDELLIERDGISVNVNSADENRNAANESLKNTLNKDSKNANTENLNDRWCEEFKNDSSCK